MEFLLGLMLGGFIGTMIGMYIQYMNKNMAIFEILEKPPENRTKEDRGLLECLKEKVYEDDAQIAKLREKYVYDERNGESAHT